MHACTCVCVRTQRQRDREYESIESFPIKWEDYSETETLLSPKGLGVFVCLFLSVMGGLVTVCHFRLVSLDKGLLKSTALPKHTRTSLDHI